MGDIQEQDDSQIRTDYTYDQTLKAHVLPSSRPLSATGGGGSYAFDANNPNITQNIVVCEGGEMTKIAEVTREQIVAATAPPAEEVEEHYKALAASEKVQDTPEPVAVVEPVAASAMAIPQVVKRAVREQEIPEATLPVAAAPQDDSTKEPIYITIKGPFGKITQPFSTVFRDGVCLVLMVDHRQLPTAYELPELEPDQAMELELRVNSIVIQCIWAGLQFTLPDGSVTFTVLLIQEETDIEEGCLR